MTDIVEAGLDFKVAKNGVVFAGTHLIIDVRDAQNLNNPKEIQYILEKAAIASGATILHSYMHPFQPQGVSGVIVLAESHISIHTWPEREYAAIDIFMCGDCDPYKAIPTIKKYFKSTNITITEHRRGVEA
ncbi:MAG: adenosylmethionine decarboxylase [Alphaproteobacteria bacterium]